MQNSHSKIIIDNEIIFRKDFTKKVIFYNLFFSHHGEFIHLNLSDIWDVTCDSLSRDVFRTLSNIYDGAFCKNS